MRYGNTKMKKKIKNLLAVTTALILFANASRVYAYDDLGRSAHFNFRPDKLIKNDKEKGTIKRISFKISSFSPKQDSGGKNIDPVVESKFESDDAVIDIHNFGNVDFNQKSKEEDTLGIATQFLKDQHIKLNNTNYGGDGFQQELYYVAMGTLTVEMKYDNFEEEYKIDDMILAKDRLNGLYYQVMIGGKNCQYISKNAGAISEYTVQCIDRDHRSVYFQRGNSSDLNTIYVSAQDQLNAGKIVSIGLGDVKLSSCESRKGKNIVLTCNAVYNYDRVVTVSFTNASSKCTVTIPPGKRSIDEDSYITCDYGIDYRITKDSNNLLFLCVNNNCPWVTVKNNNFSENIF